MLLLLLLLLLLLELQASFIIIIKKKRLLLLSPFSCTKGEAAPIRHRRQRGRTRSRCRS